MIDQASFDVEQAFQLAHGSVVSVFLTFCRVGGCLMFAPGISSALIPVQIRLLAAIACSLAIWAGAPRMDFAASADDTMIPMIATSVRETLRGVALGVTARMFLLALEFAASAASVGIGLGNPFGIAIEQNGVLPPMATFIEMSAIAMIFEMNIHLELIRGLALSYAVAPIGSAFDAGAALRSLARTTNDAFLIALHVCSPFILYSVIVNATVAIINKLTPQIAIFQISAPFIIIGGLWVLKGAVATLLVQFAAAFGAWIGNI
jgi:flagellar biosynthetic protein FliR